MTKPELKVAEIPNRDDQTTADIVSFLEEKLERARNGEYVGVTFAALNRDGGVEYQSSACGDAPAMVGGVFAALVDQIDKHRR